MSTTLTPQEIEQIRELLRRARHGVNRTAAPTSEQPTGLTHAEVERLRGLIRSPTPTLEDLLSRITGPQKEISTGRPVGREFGSAEFEAEEEAPPDEDVEVINWDRWRRVASPGCIT